MDMILTLQSWLLNISPSLLPALSITYSFLTSIHCSVMCSPLLPDQSVEKYYSGRLVSYTVMGFLLGGLGQALLNSMEFKLISVLVFIVFAALTLIVLGYNQLGKILFPKIEFKGKSSKSSLYRGFFSAFIPCHLLYFFYSLAILSGTYLGGAIILFSHAIISMPALAYGKKFLFKAKDLMPFKIGKRLVKLIIALICIVNLAYFGSRIFNSDKEAKSKIFFCI
ncbi:MAG: sulfite exporter TauE/SafE family protein [Bdellovibrionales bacterium]